MWCVGRITAEYRKRTYGLLSIYARPYNAKEPVVCVDEKSTQLLRTRPVNPCRCKPVAPPGSRAYAETGVQLAGSS